MSEISEDPRCQEIERKLDEYAEKVRWWHINRRKYVEKNYGNKFKFNEHNSYPYNDEEERKTFEQINNYLLTFANKEERAEANGHLLWKYKDYFSQPFAKHAIDLAKFSIAAHPLSDQNKIKFLEYLFKYDKETNSDIVLKFGERTFDKLMNYDPHTNLEATNRLYAKALSYLDGTKRKNANKIEILYSMFKVFGKNVKHISAGAVLNYAEIYFDMADRTDKKLDALILERLAVKTEESYKKSEMCGDEEILDKEVVKDIFKKYVQHVKVAGNFNDKLGEEMASLAKSLIKEYDYTPKEVAELINVIRPKTVDENGNKIRASKKSAQLAQMAYSIMTYYETMPKTKAEKIANICLDGRTQQFDKNDALFYMDSVFAYAKANPAKDIKIEKIFKLLTKNNQPNKELLLEVVDAYGQSLTDTDINNVRYNHGLHKKMTKMLQAIVTEYEYSPDEIKTLRRHIEKGANGHEEFVEMARVVEAKWGQKGDWRFEQAKKNIVPAIIHKKGGKSL